MFDYSENSLIEQPAIELFQSLDYTHQNCFHETFGEHGTLGRETSSNVVLIPRLRKSLTKLNPSLPAEAIDQAIEELTRDRSILNRVTANREIYKLLRDGVKVKVRREDDGTEGDEKVKVIDFNNPAKVRGRKGLSPSIPSSRGPVKRTGFLISLRTLSSTKIQEGP